MKIIINSEVDKKFSGCYLFDKVLHDYRLPLNFLGNKNTKVVFLLREPVSTIKSMVRMGKDGHSNWSSDPFRAEEYYSKRLKEMEFYCQNINNNYFFIESDELINNTANTLSSLSTWLKLKEPLIPEYKVFENTGTAGYGDFSSNIKSGVLVETIGKSEIRLPDDVIIRAKDSYKKCLEQFETANKTG